MNAGRHIDFESNYRNGFACGFAGDELKRELNRSRHEDLAYLLGYRAGKALVDMNAFVEDLLAKEVVKEMRDQNDRKEDE